MLKKPEYDESFPAFKRMIIVCIAALLIGMYDGFYDSETGTFLLLSLTHIARMDIRTASGNVKLLNLSSNIAALVTFLFSDYVNVIWGAAGAVFCLAGHYIESGLVMKKRKQDYSSCYYSGVDSFVPENHFRQPILF